MRYCVLLVCLLLSACGGQRQTSYVGPPPNVVLVLVDALRADHLGDYGYHRDTAPSLGAFAARGIRFDNAYSHSSHTKLSVASLLTGLLPPSHGVRTANFQDDAGEVKSDILAEGITTLAERLQTAGYETAGFVTNPHLQEFQGFGQGFGEFQYHFWETHDAAALNENVVEWLAAEHGAPWFAYVHYMDVHFPYDPPVPWRNLYTADVAGLEPLRVNGPPPGPVTEERIAYTRDLYDAQINYWDECFGQLMDALDSSGRLENTVVIVVADHGDEFGEHGGFGHGYTVYDYLVHVPMYFVFDGWLPAGEVRADMARLIDVVPTVCALAGAECAGVDGLDLFAAERPTVEADLAAYAEVFQGGRPRGLHIGERTVIYNQRDETWEWYDLGGDPQQAVNCYNPAIPTVRRDAELLSEVMQRQPLGESAKSVKLDEKTREELRSLGY